MGNINKLPFSNEHKGLQFIRDTNRHSTGLGHEAYKPVAQILDKLGTATCFQQSYRQYFQSMHKYILCIYFFICICVCGAGGRSFPDGPSDEEPASNAGDEREVGSIPGSGRSPGGGHGNPLQYSCLENPTDRGAWRAMVHRVAKSQTRLKQLHTHACVYVSYG